MEDILRTLVAFPSVTGDHAVTLNALEWIDQYLSSRGMRVERRTYDGFSGLVATTQRTKTPDVMLSGHIDVVPAKEYALTAKDGRYYGRGVRDMKGAIAGYLYLVDQLQDRLHEYDFGIMITSDEESRAVLVTDFLEEGFRPNVFILPDGGDGGADRWGLETHSKGTWFFTVSTSGKAAHGARPWEGDSASFKLIEILDEIKQLFKGHGPETNTLNIGQLTSGTTYNLIPDQAQALLDIRTINKAEETRLIHAVRQICEAHGATLQDDLLWSAVERDLSNSYLAQWARSLAKVTGEAPVKTISYGGSEAMRIAPYGIPCAVSYPPGGQHHSNSEWVSIKALQDFIYILHDYLDALAKIPEPDLLTYTAA